MTVPVSLLTTLLEFAGIGTLVYGASRLSDAAAIIVGGVIAVVAAEAFDRRRK